MKLLFSYTSAGEPTGDEVGDEVEDDQRGGDEQCCRNHSSSYSPPWAP
jgi:hypothetical protein